MKYFPWAVIATLIGVMICQQQCNKRSLPPPEQLPPRIDTMWRDTTVYLKDTPTLTGSKRAVIPSGYIPKKTYDSLLAQYNQVCGWYFSENYYQDTIKSDNATVLILDTTFRNRIKGRSLALSIATPTIRITDTKVAPLRRQLYIGGSISAVDAFNGMQFRAGLLYKNRRENITGLHFGIDNTGRKLYGIDAYWKISFRKK
jgi:hypothetical protein